MVVSGTGVEVQQVERSERLNGFARNARGSNIPATSRVTGKAAPSPRKRLSSSQVKKTWETIEKKVCLSFFFLVLLAECVTVVYSYIFHSRLNVLWLITKQLPQWRRIWIDGLKIEIRSARKLRNVITS